METLVEIMIDNDTWAKLGMFPSRDALEECAKKNPEYVDLLDEQEYWHHNRLNLMLSTHNDDGIISCALFGVEGNLPPIINVWHHASKVVCGVDQSIIAVSWAERKVIYHPTMLSFTQFLMPDTKDLLIAWTEMFITCLDADMQEVWFWAGKGAYVQSVTIHNDIVEIIEYNIPNPTRLNIRTGRGFG